jgi:integrase
MPNKKDRPKSKRSLNNVRRQLARAANPFSSFVHRRSSQSRWTIEFPHPRDGSRVRHIAKSSTKEDTVLEAQELWLACSHEAELAAKALVPTLAEYAEHWWSKSAFMSRNGRALSTTTVATYVGILRSAILPKLGGFRLDALSPQLRSFLADLQADRSHAPGRARAVRGVLGLILNAAYRDLVIASPIAVPAVAAPIARPRFEFLSYSEKERLLAAAANPHDRTLFRFAMETGVRPTELLALRPCDISVEQRHVVVARSLARTSACASPLAGDSDAPRFRTPKSGRSRHVPLTDVLLQELAAGHLDPGQAMLFPDVKLTSMYSRFAAAVARAGLDKHADGTDRHLRFLDLRRTFAVHLAMGGVPLVLIGLLMGHSSSATTDEYAQFCREADGKRSSERETLLKALEPTESQNDKKHIESSGDDPASASDRGPVDDDR